MSDYSNHDSDVVIPRLKKRIAELEAQAAAYEERIGMLKAEVETLTPKPVPPKVVSEWGYIISAHTSWWGDRNPALASSKEAFHPAVMIRRDTTTHPDGRVEYRLEVEK